MNNRILVLVIAIACISQANGQFINFWNATVTDATVNQCSDGAIDLHPPLSNNIYSFVWFKTGSSFPIGYTEDISDLAPGQYTVEIDGPLCDDLQLTYIVGLKEYDFSLIVNNPGNCEDAGVKGLEGNGGIFLSWNDDVSPSPSITLETPSGAFVSISNEQWVEANLPGYYILHYVVGDCEWTVIKDLCCCSVSDDLPVFPGANGLCESLTDEIPFEIQTRQVIGASDWNNNDGSIRMLISSPGLNSSLKWTGPRSSQQNFYGSYIRNLYPGEYCYEYSDDCYTVTGCVFVDNCSLTGSERAPLLMLGNQEIIGACFNQPEGSIYFRLFNTKLRLFKIHYINQNGSTGAELADVEIDNDNNDNVIDVRIRDLTPGSHTFRLITEQGCESEITFIIPQTQIDVANENCENCSRVLRCDGEIVGTEYMDWIDLPSEYCFIRRGRCEIGGCNDVVEESTFNEGLVGEIEVDGETCSFLYPCDDGPIRVYGDIVWDVVSCDCRAEPPTVRLVQVCEVTSASTDPIIVNLPNPEYRSDEVTEREATDPGVGDCSQCEIDPGIPLTRVGKRYTYTWEDDDGLSHDFECCKVCPFVPKPTQDLSIKEFNVLSSCLVESGFKSCQLVELGTGRATNFDSVKFGLLIALIENFGNVVNSSDFDFEIAPGVYVITSPICESIRVTII